MRRRSAIHSPAAGYCFCCGATNSDVHIAVQFTIANRMRRDNLGIKGKAGKNDDSFRDTAKAYGYHPPVAGKHQASS
jgi:hypothetical protein